MLNKKTNGFANELDKYIRTTPDLLGRLRSNGMADANGSIDFEKLRMLQNQRYRAQPKEAYADDFAVRVLKPQLDKFIVNRNP